MSSTNVLIVHAHPEPRSFIAAMRDVVRDHFQSQGCSVTVSDLYAMEFNPIASARDFGGRKNEDYLVYSLEQRHGCATQTIAPDIAGELEKLIAADLIVFSFPLFWFGTPAIMKGWIDRVFVSGTCFGGKRLYENGGLKGKKALAVFGLGGRSHMFGDGSLHGDLEFGMMRHFFQGTLGYVGMDVYEPFIAWHVPYIDEAARKRILVDLGEALNGLETRPILPMPSTQNFGPTFEPMRAAE